MTRFRTRDFTETRRGSCRILPPLTHALADSLPALRRLSRGSSRGLWSCSIGTSRCRLAGSRSLAPGLPASLPTTISRRFRCCRTAPDADSRTRPAPAQPGRPAKPAAKAARQRHGGRRRCRSSMRARRAESQVRGRQGVESGTPAQRPNRSVFRDDILPRLADTPARLSFRSIAASLLTLEHAIHSRCLDANRNGPDNPLSSRSDDAYPGAASRCSSVRGLSG